MTPYQQALHSASQSRSPFYVNRHPITRDEEILLAEPHKGRLCCAVAHPDGRLEYVVQGYSHAVALNAVA